MKHGTGGPGWTTSRRTAVARTLLPVAAIAVTVALSGCSAFRPAPPTPEVRVQALSSQAISPKTSPDIQDQFRGELLVDTAERLVVQSYTVEVSSVDGLAVYRDAQAKRFVRNWIFEEKEGVAVPEVVTWDGRTTSGEYVDDGLYELVVRVRDDLGNGSAARPIQLSVDNTPPEASVALPYTIFSPNGDGNKDVVPIRQDGTHEDRWLGSVYAADGSAVAVFEWQNTSPPNLRWDGRDEGGKLVPDGEYRYELVSHDKAGNAALAQASNIQVDTTETPVALSRDLGAFSPDGNGLKDYITFDLKVPAPEKVETWKIDVLPQKTQKVVRTITSAAKVPEKVRYDGTDEEGEVLPEGDYLAALEVQYVHGNNPTSRSQKFTIDLTAPSASTRAELDVFSPNGDGNKETMPIRQTAAAADEWIGTIDDTRGRAVRTYSWRGTVPRLVEWRGRNDAGELAPNGRYRYVLATVDQAGNPVEAPTEWFELDASAVPEIGLSANYEYFSPDADRTRDVLELSVRLSTREGLIDYRLTIRNDEGDVVYRRSGGAELPEAFVWAGSTTAGRSVPDGEYRAELSVRYRNGNAPSIRSQPFVVDTEDPSIRAVAEYRVFSPNGDGNRDDIEVQQVTSSEQLWEGQMTGFEGTVVYDTYWRGRAGDFVWNGRNEEGTVVPDGEYSYTIAATDRAGNSASATVAPITVDTAPTPIDIRAQRHALSPNGDGRSDVVTLIPDVEVSEGLQAWNLSVRDSGGIEVRSFSGGLEGNVPETIVWDGRNSDGAIVPDGSYSARFSVSYRKGNQPTAELDRSLIVDTRAPEARVSVSPKPFSPDDDGVNDVLSISMDATDPRDIDSWKVQIFDPRENLFIRWTGDGGPPSVLRWDGRSRDGELVQAASDYRVALAVTDGVGNTTTVSAVIPVDVLVIEEDGTLKIRISSIHFAPFSASFRDLDDRAKVQDNLETLDRLAEILAKFDEYQIRIEGYAVQIYWWDEDLAEREQKNVLLPLSTSRAEAIDEALVNRGIDPDRLSTVGHGGADPVAPHSDLDDRWKNRRVEFVLVERWE